MPERVLLTVGTRKGLFIAEAARTRGKFALRGPFGPGVAVYASLVDRRGKPRIYFSSCNPFFGMKVMRSTDMGKKFEETKSAPAFPKEDGRALANIWSLVPGSDERDLLCGVEPASLFISRDAGDSWEMVPGISNHEHARRWQPGAGGLCLHTILRDRDRLHLGISTGGHYMSEDRGKTFAPSNKGIGVGFAPEAFPEWGQCVHKIARHPSAPGRLAICRTTAAGPRGRASASCAAMTTDGRGAPSPRGFPPTSAFPSSCIRTIPRPSTSCPSRG